MTYSPLKNTASRVAHGFVSYLSILAIGVQPILAQGVVPDVTATGGLNVIAAPNDVPLVNMGRAKGGGRTPS